MKYYVAIEGGGTKFNCAVITDDKRILDRVRIPTTTPSETLEKVITFVQRAKHNYLIAGIGLACFGPLDLNPSSENYGGINKTPKPDWSYCSLSQLLADQLQLPVYVDTDVNGAVLAESLWGAARDTNVAVYVTIGTGFGGGIMANGKLLNGIHHPEMGHMLIPVSDDVKGHCPFHGACVEGLASGTSMGKTWGQKAETLKSSHQAWLQQADYIASFCHNLIVTLGPNKIILGGGVMEAEHLLPLVCGLTEKKLANYLSLADPIEQIIVPTGLDELSGLLGALALAMGQGNHVITPN